MQQSNHPNFENKNMRNVFFFFLALSILAQETTCEIIASSPLLQNHNITYSVSVLRCPTTATVIYAVCRWQRAPDACVWGDCGVRGGDRVWGGGGQREQPRGAPAGATPGHPSPRPRPSHQRPPYGGWHKLIGSSHFLSHDHQHPVRRDWRLNCLQHYHSLKVVLLCYYRSSYITKVTMYTCSPYVRFVRFVTFCRPELKIKTIGNLFCRHVYSTSSW